MDASFPRVLSIDVADASAGLTRAWIERSLAALDGATPTSAIVIESKSSAFCEGLNLEVLGNEAPGGDAGVGVFAGLLDRLELDQRPVLAVVDGPAKGGGVGLAAVADFVIATERATFALPEALIGLLPAVIFPFVARRVGVARARWLALSGESIDAQKALAWGLVDELTDDSRSSLRQKLVRLSRADARSLAAIKRLSARHFAAPAGYRDDALSAFTSLLSSEASRARARRLRDGFAPWIEDNDG
jgi:enoyl-CoA hydratase/carnithine racemase